MKQQDEEAPDQVMTRIRVFARESFKPLPDEEKQTLPVHAFCEGLKDRSDATLVATQAPNSAARAAPIVAEAIAVKIKVIDRKRHEKSGGKALLGATQPHAGEGHRSGEDTEYSEDSDR